MGALPGILMILLYVAVVIVIIRGQSPIIALLSLAILWGLLAGVPGKDILGQILDKGGTAYASAIVIIVFGAWFGQALVKTGIAENIIRGAIELAGDRPTIVAMVVSVVTGLLFGSMALLADGVEISRDTHDGFAGGSPRQPVYTLDVPAPKPDVHYTLRAQVAGSGGTVARGVPIITGSG